MGVALFSGVAATLLFFWATDQVRRNPRQLALIEATQSGEVVFSLLGGVLLLGDPLPGALGLVGLCLIVGGMVGGSLSAGKQAEKKRASEGLSFSCIKAYRRGFQT